MQRTMVTGILEGICYVYPGRGQRILPSQGFEKTTSKGSAVVLCKTGIAKGDETTEIP